MEQKFTFKKLLSLVVVCAMLLSSFTFLALADEPTNVALGKEYTISGCGVRTTYYANLTDGNAKEALSYVHDEWFGFYCNGDDATIINAPDKVGYAIIDLEGSYDISEVKINVVDNEGGSGISKPTFAKAYLSEDGETWGEAVELAIPASTTKGVAYSVEGAVEGTASFVKVEIGLAATFAFLNEIEVYGVEATEEDPGEDPVDPEDPEDPEDPADPSITVDGDLSEWEDNWTLVNGETGYWQAVPTDENQLVGSYNFQITSDETNIYVAAEISGLDCTAFRVWFRTNPEATVYTHFYHIDANGAAGKANTSTTTNSAAAIENSAAVGVFAAGEESTIVEFSVPLAEIGATDGDVEYYANTQSGSTLFYPPVVDGEGGSRTANLPYNNWYVAPEEDPGEDPVEPEVEPFNIPVGSINAYGWGNDGYPVILAYGEGGNVESKVGGFWFEWWYKVKAEWNETEGAFVVNAVDANGSKAYEAWTFTANEIVMLVYSGTETYAAAKDIIADLAIGDKLYDSGFDFTNASANNLIVDGVSSVNFSNVEFEEEPENPDPENPDPENPDPENPDPENPDPENPDPENPDPEDPDEPVVDNFKVEVNVNDNAVLTDGVSGFTTDWGDTSSGAKLIQNAEATTKGMDVTVLYALGETLRIDSLTLDFYHNGAYMIGYPEGKVLVEVSTDGETYTEVGRFDLVAAELGSTGSGIYGTVSNVFEFAAVDAAYVKATFTAGSSTGVLGDAPNGGKVFWEFVALTEVAVGEYVPPVTSNVVTDWNPENYKSSIGGATGAFIYDDADIYANCGNDWWIHASFAPVADMDGYYEVVAVRAPTTGNYLTIPENGFVWMAWSSAGDTPESEGAYALAFMSELKVGDIVNFVGVDFANHTTEADAYAEKWIDPDAPVNVALNKDYTLSGAEDTKYNANLTDGNAYAGMSYDNKWFVFNVNNTVDGIGTAIIDLAGDFDISKVAVNLINETGSGVAKPEYVKFYVSADGEEWTELGAVELQDVQSAAYWTALENLEVTGRYVKLEMKIGAPFSFLNEIEVYGKAVPVVEEIELVEGENAITVPAGGSSVANTNFDKDLVILIEGQWGVTVLVNGTEYYPNRMGNLEAPLPAGENIVEFKNGGEAAAEIVAVLTAPIVGDTMDDPIVLEQDDDYVADVTDKYPEGVYYEYTATEDGTVTITITSESGWSYVINNVTAGKYGDKHWSDDEEVVASETIDVTAGDVIQILVATYDPENPWSAPVGTVEFTLDVPGEPAPETVEIALGDINMDGVIDQYDYILAKRHYFETITLSEVQLELADVNADDVVDQFDYILLCRHYFETFTIEGTVEVPVEALPAE